LYPDSVLDSTPRISVALCTYNAVAFLAEQLESIRSQSLVPHEIVIGDDASADDTLAIIEAITASWGDRDPRVIVHAFTENAGVTANFQRTLRHTTGDIIFLSDQDDVWHPAKVERMVSALSEHPDALLAHSNARLVDADGKPWNGSLFSVLGVTTEEIAGLNSSKAYAVLAKRNLVTGATVALRRALLDRAFPIPSIWVHDEWLAVVAASSGALVCLDENLIDYRQHGRNAIGVARPSLTSMVKYLFASRGRHLEYLVARTQAFLARPDLVQAHPAVAELFTQKRAFDENRVSYSHVRLARIPAVLRNLRAGNYRRFTPRGWVDALRDVTQGPPPAAGPLESARARN
jgi:glycosyltransferase involved in cell wall biosynthesis